MAVTNYSKRCTSCGGNKWEYKKELKIWICRYCGNQVERQEEYDGLYTIKNVVRQVILDSAYRRLEQADRNISECQKINARYAGTLVAGICFRLIAAVSGGFGNNDPKALLGQLRRDYQALTEESSEMSDDETAVYEFLDSADAWAVLAMVFDTLGDEQRREYLLTLVEPSQVFSKETNKSLLRFALKNNRDQLTEQVLSNEENLDIPDAFQTVLESCPDGEMKGRLAARLLAAGAVKPGDEEGIEDYLNGPDSAPTKAAITVAACEAGLAPNLEIVMREVLGSADVGQMQQILSALLGRRLYDGEVELLIDFAAAQKDAEKCLAVLDALANSGQFVALNVRQAQNYACNSEFEPEQRKEILQRLEKFNAPDRMWETVAGYYLCQGRDSVEARDAVFSMLLEPITSVPARDFEKYVLQCVVDGEEKPARIRQILELSGMNTGFFRELAGKYLQSGKDDPEVRPAVLHQMLECGLSIDGTALIDYVCTASDSDDSKVELLQLSVKNGTALRADALSTYLEKCADTFSPQIFAALYKDASSVSNKALENYVLRCKDAPAVKPQNALTLAKRIGISLGASSCIVTHLGTRISCSLAQAYILTTKDDIGLADRMVNAMTGSGTKLTTEVRTSIKTMKFSKYLNENKEKLSPVTTQLCQDRKLFAFSFFG